VISGRPREWSGGGIQEQVVRERGQHAYHFSKMQASPQEREKGPIQGQESTHDSWGQWKNPSTILQKKENAGEDSGRRIKGPAMSGDTDFSEWVMIVNQLSLRVQGLRKKEERRKKSSS